MPVHDWTRVEDGILHDFHTAWIADLRRVLNGGVLPEGYYALAEQHAGRSIPDLLTLHASPGDSLLERTKPLPDAGGGTAVALEPPRVRHRQRIEPLALTRRRSLAIRHISGHRLIALLEILSVANKDRESSLRTFADKAAETLDLGVHVLVVDLFPPGTFDPHGIHEIILQRLESSDSVYNLPDNEPLTLASYSAGASVEAYLEHVRIGSSLPKMPLFLRPDRYINVPLEETYQSAYAGVPAFWRQIIEGRKPVT